MRILYTAFNGKCNSSKVLLDNIKCNESDKLYLKNSFATSVEQLQNKLANNNYDLIISFGEAPLEYNNIKIEIQGKNNTNIYNTTYDFSKLCYKLKVNGFNVIISHDAGNYLCNNIYYYWLKYIEEQNLNCYMIFVHIPQLDDIDIRLLDKLFWIDCSTPLLKPPFYKLATNGCFFFIL